VLCLDKLLHRLQRQHLPLIGAPQCETMRHSSTFSPRLTHPQPIRSDKEHQEERDRLDRLDKGKGCGDPTVHPETEPGPHASYEEGKRCAETLRLDYNRQRRIKIKVTRIVNIYGLSMHPNDSRVVSNVILRALRNEDMTHSMATAIRPVCPAMAVI
jgi:hypothetical protein